MKELNMTNVQDTNSKAQAEPGESLKDGAENKASQISTTSEKDVLGDSSLNDISGGLWPNSPTASVASRGGVGPGG
jgi:hypothetical protein